LSKRKLGPYKSKEAKHRPAFGSNDINRS